MIGIGCFIFFTLPIIINIVIMILVIQNPIYRNDETTLLFIFIMLVTEGIYVYIISEWEDVKRWLKSNWKKAGEIANRK